MKRSLWSSCVSLVIMAQRVSANTASAPWAGKTEEFTTGVMWNLAPYLLALVLLGIIFAWWRYGDQEGWMGSLLKFGAGASVIGGAPAFIAFFMGAAPASPSTLNLVETTLTILEDW